MRAGHLSPDGLEDLEDNCSKEGYFYDGPPIGDGRSPSTKSDTRCLEASRSTESDGVAGLRPSQGFARFADNIDDLPDPNDIVANKEHSRPKKSDTSCLRHLIIFDDLIDEKQTQLSKYFTRGRHNNINVVYISQSYFHLPRKTIRNNCNLLILFELNQKDLTNIWQDVVSSDMPIDEFKQLCSDAFEHDYGFIVIDQTADKLLKYRTGIDNYYVTNKHH